MHLRVPSSWDVAERGGHHDGDAEAAAHLHAGLHYALRATPRQANRVLLILSKMFSLAEDWGLAPAGGDPCRFVVRYCQGMRRRYLTEHEYRRAGRALRELETESPMRARLPRCVSSC